MFKFKPIWRSCGNFIERKKREDIQERSKEGKKSSKIGSYWKKKESVELWLDEKYSFVHNGLHDYKTEKRSGTENTTNKNKRIFVSFVCALEKYKSKWINWKVAKRSKPKQSTEYIVQVFCWQLKKIEEIKRKGQAKIKHCVFTNQRS